MSPLLRPVAALVAIGLTVPVAHAEDADSTADAAETTEEGDGVALGLEDRKPDPAAMPSPPGWTDKVKVKGFGTVWATPVQKAASPSASQETFRLRFARIRIAADPTPDFNLNLVLGLENADVLFDLQATWKRYPALSVSVGQFRIPFGAAIGTNAPKLTMMDRPGYLGKVTKRTFRDLGVMVHSGASGFAEGVFQYNLAAFNGSGRIPVAQPTGSLELEEYLLVGRAVLDPAKAVAKEVSTAVGLSYAYSRDGAIDSGNPDSDSATAVYHLGTTLAPFAEDRTTQLFGADISVGVGGLSAQLETVLLDSQGTSTEARVWGNSAQVAYRHDPWRTQLASRLDLFEPDFATEEDQTYTLSGGVNHFPSKKTLVSLFWTQQIGPQAAPVEETGGYQLDGRFQLAF